MGVRRPSKFDHYVKFGFLIPVKIVANMVRNKLQYSNLANPYKIIHISPHNITRFQGDFQQEDIGKIIGGTWDLETYKIEQLPKYNLVRLHLEKGYNWNKIIKDRLVPIVENGLKFDSYTTEKEIRNRYSSIENLCDNIQSEGYKSYKELDESPLALNHVGVNISRDGEFLFSGSGIHRLSIAKILDIDKIPVQVWVRHKQWQKVRDQAAENCNIPEKYIDHPDLEDSIK